MSSNNTTGTKCNKTPVSPPQLPFLMETFSILASFGLNPVWFTSISKLTDGSYPDYVQVRGASPLWPPQVIGTKLGAHVPLTTARSSLDDPGTLNPSGPPGYLLAPMETKPEKPPDFPSLQTKLN